MKRLTLLFSMPLLCAVSMAQDYGRVLSSTPIVQAVAVSKQVCAVQQVRSSGATSGAGGLLGAVAGGAVGNSIGQGGGRAAATIVGIIGGAVLGNQIEGGGAAQVQNVQRCSDQVVTENRVTGYQVQYEYAGKQYSTQLPQDPGPYVRLHIGPADAPVAPPPPPLPAPVTYYSAPAPVVVSQTVFVPALPVVYTVSPVVVYPPQFGVNLQFGPQWHGHGHGRRIGQPYWR